MRRRLVSLALISLALIAASCGGDGTDTAADDTATPTATATVAATPTVTCEPSGTKLEISAELISFDKSCLAAPAGQAFTITLNITQGTQHNVAIYNNENADQTLFKGETFEGPKVMTYNVPALQAGIYFFRCDVHPGAMRGAFYVK